MGKTNRLGLFVICCALLTVGALVVYAGLTRYDGSVSKDTSAFLNSQNIQKACKEYHLETGAFPIRLTDLIGDEKTYIEGGERALIDPWGKPYQYAIINDSNGEAMPVVWTTVPGSFGRERVVSWPKNAKIPGR
jgi:hypothetical protein